VAEFRKHTYVNALKKFYTNFEQGIQLYTIYEGATSFYNTELAQMAQQGSIADEKLEIIMKSIFKVIKPCADSTKCGFGSSYTKTHKLLSGGYYQPEGFHWGSADYAYITPDGTEVLIWRGLDPCQYNGTGKRSERCFEVFVDINGQKGPNIAGRDLFVFGLNINGKLVPGSFWNNYTGEEDIPNSAATCYNQGDACSYEILNNNWEMNY
jgi:hypothetical protein